MGSDTDCQDAYVFVSSGGRAALKALEGLWAEGDLRYVARLLSGSFGALAFVEVPPGGDGLRELRRRIARVRDLVNPGVSVGVALAPGPRAPSRWSTKYPVGAYVRIRAQAGQAESVFAAVNGLYDPDRSDEPQFYSGSALVVGDWDVLLELGAPSVDELKAGLRGLVANTPGIAWSDTALVINQRRQPKRPRVR